jgi:hypothetical protein
MPGVQPCLEHPVASGCTSNATVGHHEALGRTERYPSQPTLLCPLVVRVRANKHRPVGVMRTPARRRMLGVRFHPPAVFVTSREVRPYA